jgi:hypothetical protein
VVNGEDAGIWAICVPCSSSTSRTVIASRLMAVIIRVRTGWSFHHRSGCSVDGDATACRLAIWILCGLRGLRGNHLQLDERTVAELRNAHEGGERVALVLLGCEIAVLPTLEAIAHLRLSFFCSHAGELSR